MAEAFGSPIFSSSHPSERSSEEPLPELLEPFEDQNFELAIVLSVQPLSSRPPPTFVSWSSVGFDLESPDNPV